MRTYFTFLLICMIMPSISCSTLAKLGYIASNPTVRNILVKTGASRLIRLKADKLYETSNFRGVFDQGTDIRKAAMDNYDIIEVSPNQFQKKSGLVNHKEDRVYSEKVFGALAEMDKNGCVSRLLCEVGADPTSYGEIGIKMNNYLRSVPPVTWNSATFPYLEAFHAGLSSTKETCSITYKTCTRNLDKVMRFLVVFMTPANIKVVSNPSL